MKKLIALVLSFVLITGISGCRHNAATSVVPDTPQVAFERTVLAAADAAAIVGASLETVNKARVALENGGQITADESKKILDILKAVASKNLSAVEAIRLAEAGNVGPAADWKTAILAVAAEAKNIDPALVAIKNPNAQASFKIAVATLDAALTAVITSFGGN